MDIKLREYFDLKSIRKISGQSKKNSFIFKRIDNDTYELLLKLNYFRDMSCPSVIFSVAREEAAKVAAEVDSRNRAKTDGQPYEIPKSHVPTVQALLQMTDAEYSALEELQKWQSTMLWDDKPNARIDLLEYCRIIGFFTAETNEDFLKRTLLLRTLYQKQYALLEKLSAIKLKNPAVMMKELEGVINEALVYSRELGGPPYCSNPEALALLKMSPEDYKEMLDSVKYWNGKPECDVIRLFCRTAGLLPVYDSTESREAVVEIPALREYLTSASKKEHLADLENRIHIMRKKLLGTVCGQDRAVHMFCDGLFNAEVLDAIDTGRKTPKAIFTFAGPPGVGKTFLAKQAAEYLNIPFKRFDMTEYSGENDSEGLIGFDYTWAASSEGKLTSFVNKNPRCILMFDEIEKAHKEVIQIFYQMLDEGIVTDKYVETHKIAAQNNALRDKDTTPVGEILAANERVSFKDAIIIFTSNVGRSLYERESPQNAAGISQNTLLNALKTEKKYPGTENEETFFPAALVSRIATGYPMLFNHLEPHNLLEISKKEFDRCKKLFNERYGIVVRNDDKIITSLLFAGGGITDARTLKAQTQLFFKNQIHRLLSAERGELGNILPDLRTIRFSTRTKDMPPEVKRLFFSDDDNKPEVLLYSSELFADICKNNLSNYILYHTRSLDEAMTIAAEKDLSLALIDIAQGSVESEKADGETVYGNDAKTSYASLAAKTWRDGKRLFGKLREKKPELPVYLLETTAKSEISEELLMNFMRAGARGKLQKTPGTDFDDFADMLKKICRKLYMLKVASQLAAQRKVLYFETAQKFGEDEARAELRNFELKRAPEADDVGYLLDDSEIPEERFEDVIGTERAKEELKIFIDYLKNAKAFRARQLKTPRGVLLYGSPGTGKTMLAKAMAGESEAAFIEADASELCQKGPDAVRELFARARRYAPAIVFIDEIDAIGRQRAADTNQYYLNVLNALLTEMDGFSANMKKPVFVLAATNFDIEEGQGGIGKLDDALLRRFDSRVLIDLPNTEERRLLIETAINKINEHNITENGVRNFTERSEAFRMSPAAIVSVIEQAKRLAFRKGVVPCDELLTEALELITYGEENPQTGENPLRTARHEAGHGLVYCLGGYTPSFITIVARGGYGGYMARSLQDINTPAPTKKELLSRVRTSLGGYAAEVICYGTEDEDEGISSGASSDLRVATEIVRSMITKYGMYKELGLAVLDYRSEQGGERLEALINKILMEQLLYAKELITQNREKFDRFVNALTKKKKLTEKEIQALMKDE